MTVTVTKSIGATGRDYPGPLQWIAGLPLDLTLTRSNTTQSGSTSSNIKLDASASAVTDQYKGLVVSCDARPTEKRLITAYDATTKIATIGSLNGSSATWANTPGVEAYTIENVCHVGECYNDGEFAIASNTLVFGTRTTSTSNFIVLTAAAGHSFKDNVNVRTNALHYDQTKGVGFSGNPVSTAYIDFTNVGNVTISRIQMKCTGDSSALAFLTVGTSPTIVVQKRLLQDCIFEINANSRTLNLRGNTWMINCVAIHGGSTPSTALVTGVDATSTNATIINCTVVRNGGVAGSGVNCNSTLAKINNTAVLGFTTCFNGTWNAASNGNASTDATAIGTRKQPNVTYANQVVSPTGDWRLISTSDLINACDTDTTNAPNDISGLVRATGIFGDIGAWEFLLPANMTLSATLDNVVGAFAGTVVAQTLEINEIIPGLAGLTVDIHVWPAATIHTLRGAECDHAFSYIVPGNGAVVCGCSGAVGLGKVAGNTGWLLVHNSNGLVTDLNAVLAAGPVLFKTPA